MIWAALDTAERTGLDVPRLLEGLPFDATSVRKLRRVDWQHYCAIIERGEAQFESPEACQRAIETHFNRVIPEMQAMARSVVSVKALVRFIYELIDPIMVPPVEFTYEDRGPDRVRVTVRLRPGVRPCLAFFRLTIGGMRGLPRHLGLPSARVVADISPVHGVYDLVLPRARTAVERLQRAASRATRFVLGYSADGDPISAALGPADEMGDDLEAKILRLVSVHQLTEKQAEVLRHIACGQSTKEIANDLERADSTVEAHLTQIFRKVGVDSRAMLMSRLFS